MVGRAGRIGKSPELRGDAGRQIRVVRVDREWISVCSVAVFFSRIRAVVKLDRRLDVGRQFIARIGEQGALMIRHRNQPVCARAVELIVGASVVAGAAVAGAVVEILECTVGTESRSSQSVGGQDPSRARRSVCGNQSAGRVLVITGVENMDVDR